MKIKLLFLSAAACAVLFCGCVKPEQGVGAVSSASVKTNLYGGMNIEELAASIQKFEGSCSVATVNPDGSPNIAVFIPGYVDKTHIAFGWAQNATKANVLRTKAAAAVYDVPNLSAPSKNERHKGAVLHLKLEDDKKTLEEIRKKNPSLKDTDIILKIVQLMPIG